MPGYDIRSYLSMQSASIDKPADTSASAADFPLTTTTTTADQQQQHATTPRTPRHSSAAIPPRRHLPWLHGPPSAKKSPRTPRTVRIAEGADSTTPTTANNNTTTFTTPAANTPQTTQRGTTIEDFTTMSTTTTPSFSRTTSSHYTPRSGHGGSRGGGSGSGRRGGRGAAQNRTPRGCFEDNTWYCDCGYSKKLPAAKFRVKKEGPNKGRWFYTCQKKPGDEQRCGFFMWEEDAKTREDGAVSAGSVSGADVGRGNAASSGTAAKRKWQEEVDGEAETEDEDEYGWDQDTSVEAAIGRVLDAVSTPSRKVLKMKEGATPRGDSAMVMTPVSQRGNGGGVSAAAATKATPTPAMFGTVTPSTSAGGGGSAAAEDDVGDALVVEVLQVLDERDINLDDEANEALQEVLKSHSLRMQNLARGRDISRLAVRERNAKLAELQARVKTLEAELETQRAVIANLNWQKETGQFN
ncbi:Px domain-containing protein [Lasiodiplodia theobromae]|uniref:DNA topoisomerase 3-alpha n=1 Tax=Lasiodiplodia theobromae TaxID=45133 RepID=A0A5N5D9M3_9PEZI|nr:Px domain-containing protein [Lasiodiplodia theobromae]KAB2573924.1 DNA topoisomerase 3-alpha [Lasiodiplodia theobromae]KAF4538318.1 Px domain-containing protein [Lasiodiplodia theobromae]